MPEFMFSDEEESSLAAAGFVFKRNSVTPSYSADFERQQKGFLQRIVLYKSLLDSDLSVPKSLAERGVLFTKCAPWPVTMSLFDVERVHAKGTDTVAALISAADSHWLQFAVSGNSSFFSVCSEAIPHYNMQEPVELASF